MNRYEQDQRREDEASIGEQAYDNGKFEELKQTVIDILPRLSDKQAEEIEQLFRVELIERDVKEYAESLPF